ncbi:MAG TPA: hypothetical protein DEB05_09145 [Firmicutes bacterium]|nr:hypothetical protein [Bacillota bacterium]
MAEVLLQMKAITKRFPGVIALDNVNLEVEEGEIHALVGENGAGKSTLMKILFGIESPDTGRILLNGQEVRINNPSSAIKYGIGMVHQHFMLAPSLTVAENMVMGIEPKNWFLFDFARALQMTKDIAEKYHFDIDPKAYVKDLSVGQKQKVEILKALLRGAQILILDEPTRGIDVGAKSEIHRLMSKLANEGKAIIMISSELPEILGMSDRIVVMHEGRKTGELTREEATQEKIMKLATGMVS